MNKIKIICTIGPSSSSEEMIIKLIDAGMNIARLNFSHGTHEDHKVIIDRIKKIREKTGRNIGILQDLCGPKIRVCNIPGEGLQLEKGKYIRLTPDDICDIESEIPVISISYEHLLEDVVPGKEILMDDGQLGIVAEKIEERSILCKVIYGGLLKSRKGVNFPKLTLSQKVPTDKDLRDLEFGLKNGVDFVALSFVQTPDQVISLKKKIKEMNGSALVVAKLERETAIENLDGIIEASDAIMVARGDLGIETDISMIPVYQKLIVRKCNLKGTPVITATQMLDSMIKNPIPTRAEATDVANAIYDGSDAIMLSGETASGKYPQEAVKIMRSIANNVESNLWLDRGWVREESADVIPLETDLSIAHAIFKSSAEVKAKCIVANTISGQTARRIAMYRPKAPIVAVTPDRETCYQLALVWGVQAVYTPKHGNDLKEIIDISEEILKSHHLAEPGDIVVISSGTPGMAPGGTDIMKLHRIQ